MDMQLIFYVPIAFGALLVIAAVLGLLELGGDDASFDVDVDLDAEVDADAEGDGEGDEAGLLALLGVGRAPLGILVTSACFVFGVSGLALEALGASVATAAAIAALIALASTGSVARLLGRLVPSKETYASRKADLLGRVGTAELPTDARFGLANVIDDGGARIRIRCRTIDDEPIDRGEPLVVAEYDEDTDTFLVARVPR